MKRILLAILITAFLLSACAAPALPAPSLSQASQEAPEPTSMPTVASEDLPDLGLAPELHNGPWINTDALKLADLRGQVVLLEMWTFGCYNCRNVLPHVSQWYQDYMDDGLVVIGNHYPEFDFEANFDNLQQAVKDLNINFPVLQDNDRQTWAAYHNRYWPTIYLIDKQGHLRYQHIGEGAYAQTEAAIQTLLAE